jgi:putative methyltransferase (TIGR04325 family)
MNEHTLKMMVAGAHAAGKVPLFRAPLRRAYERYYFNRARGQIRLFSGVYPDFAAALEAIPADRRAGHDHPATAKRFTEDLYRVFAMDYPVMFWLSRLLPQCRLLFDWGGNIGLSYFAFQRHLQYPAALTWLVSDLPAVVREGEERARQAQATGLQFTSSLERLSEADLLLAAGSLHFIERPFAMLRAQRALPRHLLFNKVPVYERPAAVTLQNLGTALVPNHLFNEGEFLGQIQQLGYRLIDSWQTDLACRIPFYPEYTIDAYKGYYFAA